jgi:hypothetical protein
MRVTRLKIFVASTLEDIEMKFDSFFTALCPGNVLSTKLYRLGGVYQYEVLYAIVL